MGAMMQTGMYELCREQTHLLTTGKARALGYTFKLLWGPKQPASGLPIHYFRLTNQTLKYSASYLH